MRERFRQAERALIARLPLGIGCAVFCLTSSLLVFVLPFHLPVAAHPVISASYVAGFNNRAAALATAAVSLLGTIWCLRRQRLSGCVGRVAEFASEGLSALTVVSVVALTVMTTAICGWALHISGQRYLADAGYFIEQASKYAEHAGRLYSDIEFAYGPLLFYPTVLLQKVLQCSTFAAYFVTLALEQAIGLLELAFVLNQLPLSVRYRRFAFVLFAVGALNPLLGLNYTLFRYVTPVAVLLYVGSFRSVSRSAVVLALGQVVTLGISAEIGLAYAFGSLILLLWKTWTARRRWLLALIGPISGAGFFVLTIGRAYFRMLSAFAGGALNLPVLPYPHLLVFLFCVFWFVPLLVGRLLASRTPCGRSVLICYAFSIALLPSALGRCDPLHVFFNGLFFFVLSIVEIQNAPLRLQNLWELVLVLSVVWQSLVTNHLFRFRTADTLSAVLPSAVSDRMVALAGEESPLGKHLNSNADDYQLDVRRLEQSIGSATVATPLEITPDAESALKNSHHFRSSYFAYMVDTFSRSAEQQAINEMNTAEWALIPAYYTKPFLELPGNLQDLQGIGFPVPTRHAIPFVPGVAMAENLQNSWSVADTLGPYHLLRRLKDERR